MRRFIIGSGLVVAATLLTAGTILAATITAHVGSYYFEDSSVGDGRIDAHVGDQIKFIVDDAGGGGKPHSVVVTELGIDSGGLLAGSSYVTPVLDTPGTYVLFCRFHRVSADHWTTLVVTGTKATPAPTRTPPPPTPTPAATAATTARPGASGTTPSAAPGGTAAPQASAAATPEQSRLATATAPGTSDASSAIPTESGTSGPAPVASGESPLPVGVTGPPALVWLRSAVVGALLLPLLVATAAIAFLAAARRSRGRS